MERGVYAVGHVHDDPLVRRMACVLACGDGAVLSHLSALAHWALRPTSAARVHVTVPGPSGRARRRRMVVHRSIALPADEVTSHRHIPVTTVARTLLDSAALLHPAALSRAVERSEIDRRFDLSAIERTLALHPTHRGAQRLAAAIALYRDDELTRSELEHHMLALCDAHAVARPLVNHIVEGEEVDFLWRDQRLIVESDGRRTHLTRAAFERDRARDAKLTVAGYRVVRFTHRQIVHAPDAVGALLAQLRSISSIR